MRSRSIRHTLTTLALLCGMSIASDTDIQTIVNLVSQQHVTDYQHAIEGMGLGNYGGTLYNQGTRGRAFIGVYGDKGNQEARKYLVETLSGFGLDTSVQGKFYNVVAEQKGVTNPQNVLIIAAHYDTLKSTLPGGDADASGTAGVIEAARVLSQYTFDNTIRFVVFNATSKRQVGSLDYVAKVVGVGTENLLGVVYLDSILHPYHDNNPALPQALSVGISDKKSVPLAWADAFSAAALQFVPTLALDASGPVLDVANDQFAFITFGYIASLRLSENSSKDKANASISTPADASDGAAGAHYDYAFATDVVRATVALMAQQAGFVGPAASNGGAYVDSDGDGFSDEIETVLGSDPGLIASTPSSLPSATRVGTFELSGAVVALDFSSSFSDLVSVAGTLRIHAGFAPLDTVAIVDVGGVVKSFVLKSMGAGKIGSNTFSLKVKNVKGVVSEQLAPVTFTLGQGNFKQQFGPLGLTNLGFRGKPVTIPVTIILAGEVHRATRLLIYSGTKNINGIAR
ncbi:MAG: M28 family peptidase [Planctomycetota bacterium]